MTAEAIELYVINDKAMYNHVVCHIDRLRSLVDRAAEKLAKENAAWHDDPNADNHAAYHAPADVQFPRAVRDEAILSLVGFYLRKITLQENQR